MRELPVKREGLRVFHGDAGAVRDACPPASVDLLIEDWPYFRVKDEPWDRQWDKPEGFLQWVRDQLPGIKRVLKPNGSLYVFASPDMAARVECVVREQFNVLNHIVWAKPEPSKAATYGEERLRSYISKSERIIFAEHYGDGGGTVIGDAVRAMRERAGLTRNEVEVGLGFVSRSDPSRGTALCYRWEEGSSIPTAEAYERLRDFLNSNGQGRSLNRPCADLCETGESSRRDYEELRREFEALRRPFFATPESAYEDVWDFPTVQSYPGKHPCEKPQELLRHIIRVSSRPGDTVMDLFCGSGSTGEAALSLGRKAILGDASEHWAQYAAARVDRQFGALPLGSGRTKKAPRRTAQAGLFTEAP